MAKAAVAASCSILSMSLASAKTTPPRPAFYDRPSYLVSADIGSFGAEASENRKSESETVSRRVYVAEDSGKSAPKELNARARQRGSIGPRRPGTRKPIDPVPSAECLANGTCAKPSPRDNGRPRSDNSNPVGARPNNPSTGLERAPDSGGVQSSHVVTASPCAASAGLRNIPSALRKRLLTLGASEEAKDCARAVDKLSPLRQQLRDAYENALPEDLSEQFTKAATGYIAKCLGHNLLLDQGALTAAEKNFLLAHTGFIVRQSGTGPQEAQPVCEAARLGNFVVTAQHCVPIESSAYRVGGGYRPKIAFRFIDRPSTYALVPRMLNRTAERNLDYAVLEIVEAPELREELEPLVGKMELFADFYDLTANIYSQIVNRQNNTTAPDFYRATLYEHSTLCRPAYIGMNGLFLHACQTEAGLSGTPFFQRQGGRLVFVGIHNGVTEALEDPSLAACAFGLPNYGVSIAPSTLIGIKRGTNRKPKKAN